MLKTAAAKHAKERAEFLVMKESLKRAEAELGQMKNQVQYLQRHGGGVERSVVGRVDMPKKAVAALEENPRERAPDYANHITRSQQPQPAATAQQSSFVAPTDTTFLTKCAICLSTLKSPKRLPCLHSCCLACLESHSQDGVSPQCPKCKCAFQVPEEGLSTLPADQFTLNILLTESEKISRDPNHITCEICEETEAASHCVQCNQFFCGACQRTHLKARSSSAHTFVAVEEGLKPAATSRLSHCQVHPLLLTDYFCSTCHVACCAECFLKGHKHHTCTDMREASTNFKAEMQAIAGPIQEKCQLLGTAVARLGGSLETLRQNALVAQASVEATFAEIREDLAERQAQILQDIEEARHNQEKKLRLQKEDLEGHVLEVTQTLQYTEAFLREGTDAEIVLGYVPVLTRLETLSAADCALDPVASATLDFKPGTRDDMIRFLGGFGTITKD